MILIFSLQPKILVVGEELKEETLQFKFGKRLYKLVGLREKTWYEIKISYPASVRANFNYPTSYCTGQIYFYEICKRAIRYPYILKKVATFPKIPRTPKIWRNLKTYSIVHTFNISTTLPMRR
jgi:hypothetical protein